VLRVTISSEARLLHVLRGIVRWRAQASGFPSADEECLVMAIDEAAANVIRHTYANRADGRLALEIQTFPDRIEFVLEDSGPKVREENIRHRPLDEVRPGGLGTYFINCFVDKCSYDADFSQGNRLRLVKYLPGRAATGDASSSPQHR